MKKCSIEGCEKKHNSKGFCRSHYMKNKAHGNPLFERIIKLDCNVEGCHESHLANGFCNKHLLRYKKHGDPLIDMSLKRQKCIIEKCNELQKGLGYCRAHYVAFKKHGHPLYRFSELQSVPDKEIEHIRELARKMAREHFKGIKFLCFYGGCKAKEIELHHEDYTKPLDIIPFCRKHHMKRHVKIRKEKFYNNLKEQEVASSLAN